MFPSRVVSAPQDPIPARTNTDVLTIILAHALSLVPSVQLSADEVALVSRQISLALVGIIIFSSIRLVLRGVARVGRYERVLPSEGTDGYALSRSLE